MLIWHCTICMLTNKGGPLSLFLYSPRRSLSRPASWLCVSSSQSRLVPRHTLSFRCGDQALPDDGATFRSANHFGLWGSGGSRSVTLMIFRVNIFIHSLESFFPSRLSTQDSSFLCCARGDDFLLVFWVRRRRLTASKASPTIQQLKMKML